MKIMHPAGRPKRLRDHGGPFCDHRCCLTCGQRMYRFAYSKWAWRNAKTCSARCFAVSKNTDRNPDLFWAHVATSGADECWLWTGGTRRGGYGVASLHNRSIGAHRLAWMLTRGAIPRGMLVCHHCDVPACCNPAHLFLGTISDNARDMLVKHRGRYRTGEQRLNMYAVRVIRWAYERGDDLDRIAALYRIPRTYVRAVGQRRIWRWVV